MGHSRFSCLHFVCISLAIILPVSMAAQETASAVLRTDGAVLLNKNPAPATNALFRNDLIETQKAALARVDLTGSTADINPDTMIQFEEDELVLDHGSLSVNTSRGLRVRVGCLSVVPLNTAGWTHYEVADVDGRVTVWARKNDVYIDAKSRNLQPAKVSAKSAQSNRSIVHESEQTTRDENCAGSEVKRSAIVAGPGAILSSPWAIGAGAIAVAAATCWALCRNDEPISPSGP